jgi:predicted regulator of Ras-like GTPase activity (Roadblock/LC7/MglB family)
VKKNLIDSKAIKSIVSKFMADEQTRAVIICDSEGLPIQSSYKGEQIERTEEISAYITSLISRAKQTAEVLGEGRLNFVRLETDKGEVMIAPQEGLILIVLRTPSNL